ncbi:DUF1203 domain-containing protein [Rhizobium sp. TRM96647]|uniref:DUF1203 domain-containing protein n=1 Tax=unclassified Rhizobium TaxID=2613769 RepID=UPI0021E81FED|nr:MULTISPECIES: DUF1203 domain-containing protein [unclassified Rhizobium]MCV3737818.1 DUF1203 domain-containing protein [Rhizobium sp. TRM96647]MCV3759452.1 DUF1203 domain-containing protein [Rhizobium sp. TRM96650]
MPVQFLPLPTETATAYWNGGPDAYGMAPERAVSDGDGVPCRHCLSGVMAGETYLILAHRPFPDLQPYAETGPIFLHAAPCPAYAGPGLPPMLESRDYIVRGYDNRDRIVYGTGAVIPTGEIAGYAEALLDRIDIAYVHVRSARNNCYQCKIVRT